MISTQPLHCCTHCGFTITYMAFIEEFVRGRLVQRGFYCYYNRYDDCGQLQEGPLQCIRPKGDGTMEKYQQWFCEEDCKYNYDLLTNYFGEGFVFYHKPYQGFKFPVEFEEEYMKDQKERESNRIKVLTLLIIGTEEGLGIMKHICPDILKIIIKEAHLDKCLLLKERYYIIQKGEPFVLKRLKKG